MKLMNVVLSYCALGVNIHYSFASNIPTLFNIHNNSTGEITTAEEFSCVSLGYNLNDECVKVRINFALLDSVITADEVGVQFKLFDDISFTNQVITNYNLQQSHGMYPYKTIELTMTSLQKGLIIIDNNKIAATYSDINGTVIVQPCNDLESSNECYMAIKIASENLNKLDIPYYNDTADFQSNNSVPLLTPSETTASPTGPSVLTISFAFTPIVASRIGEDNLRLRSLTLVEVMNQAMKNSQVDNILQLRLQEAFVYNGVVGTDASTTLIRFSGTDTKGAHVAALVVSDLGFCGIAHFYCAQYSSPQLQSCPYFVLDQTCLEYSVAHEFGHLLGMQHDIDNGVNFAFPFGQGYIDVPNKFRTIMSYPSGDTQRIGYYSSNIIKTSQGYPLGNDNKNNRQVLILTAKILADKLEALIPKTLSPTVTPSTLSPTVAPSSLSPTVAPTLTPTVTPSTLSPTVAPTLRPTVAPTLRPTVAPTLTPTVAPTLTPTVAPTLTPTVAPTLRPTVAPTLRPTVAPTLSPTVTPSTHSPTVAPPSLRPTVTPSTPSPTVTPSTYCAPYQQVLPNLAWNENTLAASLINSDQKTILFTINRKRGVPNAILKLNLLCSTNSSNIIITGNGPKKLKLRNNDKFLITFNDYKHATVSVLNPKNNLKLRLPIEAQCELNGFVKYAGRGISQLSNVKCYSS